VGDQGKNIDDGWGREMCPLTEGRFPMTSAVASVLMPLVLVWAAVWAGDRWLRRVRALFTGERVCPKPPPFFWILAEVAVVRRAPAAERDNGGRGLRRLVLDAMERAVCDAQPAVPWVSKGVVHDRDVVCARVHGRLGRARRRRTRGAVYAPSRPADPVPRGTIA